MATGAEVSFETDLSAFYPYVRYDALNRGSFAKIKTLGKAIHGKVEQCRWTGDGFEVPCAVKKMPNDKVVGNQGVESNDRRLHFERIKRHPEDALNEICDYDYVQQQAEASQDGRARFILRLLGVFRDEGPTGETWVVTEVADGGECFAAVADGGLMSEVQIAAYMYQLLCAVSFMHEHNVGHRDISLENLLLQTAGSGTPELRLMDFGQAVRLRSDCGTQALRYFSPVGKQSYRAPECVIPRQATHLQVDAPPPPADGIVGGIRFVNLGSYLCEVALPLDAIQGQVCQAQLMGYDAAVADLFSCGVCLFIMNCHAPPWRAALLDDPYFKFVHGRGDTGVPRLIESWKRPVLREPGMNLMVGMMRSNPRKRPGVRECLESEWFAHLRG